MHPDDTWIDDLLTRSRPAPLKDDGFSARVLAALPPPPMPAWQRSGWIMLATILGCALALFVLPGGAWLTSLVRSLALRSLSPAFLLVTAGVLLALITPILHLSLRRDHL